MLGCWRNCSLRFSISEIFFDYQMDFHSFFRLYKETLTLTKQWEREKKLKTNRFTACTHNVKISMHNIRMNHVNEEEISKYGICVTNLVCKKEIISIVNELQSIWNSISISVSIVTACMHTSGEWKRITEREWNRKYWVNFEFDYLKKASTFLTFQFYGVWQRIWVLAFNIFPTRNIIAISLFSLSFLPSSVGNQFLFDSILEKM